MRKNLTQLEMQKKRIKKLTSFAGTRHLLVSTIKKDTSTGKGKTIAFINLVEANC